MSLKTTIKNFIVACGQLPLISEIVHQQSVQKQLEKLPGLQLLYPSGWDRIHPFDRFHGTDTSGVVTATALPADEIARAYAVDYAGSQPSVLRSALSQLPKLASYTFLDLGCGKGRPLLVASEFSFREIIGVELSPPLAQVAQQNATIIANRFPARGLIAIHHILFEQIPAARCTDIFQRIKGRTSHPMVGRIEPWLQPAQLVVFAYVGELAQDVSD